MDLKSIEQQAEDSFAAKGYDQCLSLLEPWIGSEEATLSMHKLYAEALYARKKFVQSLPSFQHRLHALGQKCEFAFFQKARTAVKKSKLSQTEQLKFWKSCTNFESNNFILSMEALLAHDLELAERHFEEGLQTLYKDEAVRKIWKASFLYLKNAFQGIHIDTPVPPQRIQKILVSGMGWSGSSAFYDYFFEFDEVVTLSQEMSFIEGTYGLRCIFESVGDEEKFVRSCILFFYHSLLGQGQIDRADVYRSLYITHKLIRKLKPLPYAKKSQNVAKFLAKCIDVCKTVPDSINATLFDLSAEAINQFSVQSLKKESIILLDNAIHIGNLLLLKYINDISVLCSFRDPRAQYAALIREYAGFNQSCEEFIADVKKKRENAEHLIDELNQYFLANKMNTCIQKIEFENFVLSERFRDGLAQSLGLDLSKQKKHSRFKPWESMRNVIIHQEHPAVGDIKKIEMALRNYCREPAVDTLYPER